MVHIRFIEKSGGIVPPLWHIEAAEMILSAS
jgi:hypothetical protein